MMEIDVHESDLIKRTYVFTIIRETVYLEYMYRMERESTRHKFKINMNRSYSRIHKRDHGVREEPEVPIEVSSQAVWHYRQQVTFKPWKDNYK
jgi:hypothetical protein